MFGHCGAPPPPFLRLLLQCFALPPFLITTALFNWANGARARVSEGGALLTHGARGWRGCWLPAQQRAPSPSPAAGGL